MRTTPTPIALALALALAVALSAVGCSTDDNAGPAPADGVTTSTTSTTEATTSTPPTTEDPGQAWATANRPHLSALLSTMTGNLGMITTGMDVSELTASAVCDLLSDEWAADADLNAAVAAQLPDGHRYRVAYAGTVDEWIAALDACSDGRWADWLDHNTAAIEHADGVAAAIDS